MAESILRRWMADRYGYEYWSLPSLADAQCHDDGVVVLEGDDGGQIYAVFPAREVRCTEDNLVHLLRDIDMIATPGLSDDSRAVFFERHDLGSTIAGGMGGGRVERGGWIHPELRDLGMEGQIRKVVAGYRRRMRPMRRAW